MSKQEKPPPSLDLHLHHRQGLALETVATEVLYGGSAGAGKALALDTPLATPFGWTMMGEVQVGDILFDEAGAQCRVVATTPIMSDRKCYRVTFSDDTTIIADAAHEWLALNTAELLSYAKLGPEWRAARRARRPSVATGKRSALFTATISARNASRVHDLKERPIGTVRTTEEMAGNFRRSNGGAHYCVPVAKAISCAEKALLVSPYVLGAWLGDGNSAQAAITTADEEILAEMVAEGQRPRFRPSTKYGYGLLGNLQQQLRTLGVLNNKHIPVTYLRASEEQRLALLQGLMDTDGHAQKDGHMEFSITRKQLAEDVRELIVGLGIKVNLRVGRALLDGRYIGPKYILNFVSEKPCFRLPRKLIRQKRGGFRGTHARRYITSIDPVESVPVRCIQVDSPSHLYLAGLTMVPTHNSHLLRTAAVVWCGSIPGLQFYLFRRLRDDLVKNHIEGPRGLRAMLTAWTSTKLVTMVEDEVRFWNGSKIYLCHCKDEKDRLKYLGSEIHVLGIDELTTFTPTIYRFLRSRVRMAGITVPPQFSGMFPRIICGSNPGGIGHNFVKSMFIDARPPMEIEQVPPSEGGMMRQFIPAKLADNPSIDPNSYVAKLEGLGSPALVKAMRDGDWNVVAGAFFPEFSTEQHVMAPVPLPAYWQRFRSFDWGSARPFCVLWYAVSDGELANFPRGALIVYREWYGAPKDASGLSVPNVGLRMTAEEVANGIVEREKGDLHADRVMSGVADPSIFAEDGGPSIADRMAARKVYWRPADNARVARNGAMGGWDQVRARLKGDGEKPALFIFSTCRDLIRTLPTVQHDEGRPEDMSTDGDDHCCDSLRYGTVSRPYVAPLPPDSDPHEPDRYARRWKPARRTRGSAMSA